MLVRELPATTDHGGVIRLAGGRVAPAPDGGIIQAARPWTSEMQPLCFWGDLPIALSLETQAGDDWPDGREW